MDTITKILGRAISGILDWNQSSEEAALMHYRILHKRINILESVIEELVTIAAASGHENADRVVKIMNEITGPQFGKEFERESNREVSRQDQLGALIVDFKKSLENFQYPD